MALPSTGSISMSQVNTELKKSATATISLNDSAVRKLAGKTSGTISMNDLRGKKASESVSNYLLFENTFEGVNESGNFTVNFPHKVISGKIFFQAGSKINQKKQARATLLGSETIGTYNVNLIELSCPINIMSLTGTYFTGSGRNNSGSTTEGQCRITVKFTGEWEA